MNRRFNYQTGPNFSIQPRTAPDKRRFQCIGDDLRGYFVEAKNACDTRVWIIPGTYRDDPLAPAQPSRREG